MSLDLSDNTTIVDIHQTYLELVVEDDLASMQDPVVAYTIAIEKLEAIKDELDHCPNAREEIMDYYSQDPNFDVIVGSYDRYQNLCNYIAECKSEISSEVVEVLADVLLGINITNCIHAWYTTMRGMRGVADSVIKSEDIDLFNKKCRYTLPPDKLMTVCKEVNVAMSQLEKWVQHPDSFDTKQASAIMSKLGVKVSSPSVMEHIGAGTKGAVIGALKTLLPYIGISLAGCCLFMAGVGYGVVVSLARVATSATFMHFARKSYKRAIDKNSDQTMGQMGWTAEKFRAFAKEYDKLNRRALALEDLVDKTAKTEDKGKAKRFKAYINVVMACVKGLGKCLVSMADSAKIK